jgi:hypothetical protein
MSSSKHIVGSQGGAQVGPPAVLSTPCTLQALRNWLKNIDVLGVGGDGVVQITTTSSTIVAG